MTTKCGYIWSVALWLLLAVWVEQAYALDYYHARVAVDSQSTSERKKAAREGLRQVLVRVSGTVDIGRSQELLRAMNSATSFIDQYQYDLQRDQWGGKQEYLSMSFAPLVIEKLLQKAGMPFWPINRPNTLVWLVKDDPDSGKQLVNDTQAPMVKSLMVAAQQRGVPFIFPLLDLDDQLAVSADAVWSMNEDAILDASERYATDTVLVGRYTQTSSGQWWATWQFFHRGDNRMYDLREDDVTSMGRFAVDPLADYLAGRYAVVPNVEGTSLLVMQIDGVNNFADYRGVMSYLSGLAAVSKYSLSMLVDSSLLLRVQLSGDLQQFNNVISLDPKLRSQETRVSPSAPWMAVPRGTDNQPLMYQWIDG